MRDSGLIDNSGMENRTLEKDPFKPNIENVTELADFLASEKYIFDMADPYAFPKCNSAGCIGGHAAVLWPDVAHVVTHNGHITWDSHKLAEKFNISIDAMNRLCHMIGSGYTFQAVTRDDAVRYLRIMAEGREPTWHEILGDRTESDYP